MDVICKMPKYKEIIRELIKIIEANNMEQGDKLPSIEILMEQFDAGKNTILKALDELEKQAYIYQVRGSGSFVRKHRRKGYINITEINGLKNNLRDFDLGSKMLDLKVIKPTPEVMVNLNVDENEDVYYVKRLRSIEGRKFSVEESYYLKAVVPYLNQEIVEDSIFAYLINDLKVKPGFTDQFLRVTTLNKENADLLELEPGDPTILLESIFFLKNGQPFDYSKIIYHYEESQFFVQGFSYLDL